MLYKSSFFGKHKPTGNDHKLDTINEKNVTIIEAGHIEDIISPILSNKQVVSTSTPSSNGKKKSSFELQNETPRAQIPLYTAKADNYEQINNNNEGNIQVKKIVASQSTTSLVTHKPAYSSERITKNQGLVKIVQSEEIEREQFLRRTSHSSQKSAFSTNETKISAIEMLDRCIAEFESDTESLSRKNVFSSSSNTASVASSLNTNSREKFDFMKKTSIPVLPMSVQFSQRNEDLGSSTRSQESIEKIHHEAENDIRVYTQMRSYKSEVQIYSKDGLVTSPVIPDANNNFIASENQYEKVESDKENREVSFVPPPAPPPPPPPPPMPANWSTMGAWKNSAVHSKNE